MTSVPEYSEKIGLLGGTFNPIHSGHLKAAHIVFERFALDKILFIPSCFPPHKESGNVASPGHRFQMVKLALQDEAGFIASPLEIEEIETSYSIMTLHKIKIMYPRAAILFILGIDAFLEIETWKDYESVLDQCHFVVISRKGYRLDEGKKVLKGKYISRMVFLSAEDNPRPAFGGTPKIFFLPFDALDVSSSAIRKRLRKGLSVHSMIPEAVADYIVKNHLYM